MADWARDTMRSWAAAHGLQFAETGRLPASTRFLCEALQVAPHRAGIVTHESDHSVTSVGGFTKRPGRYTENLCSGRLPGGLDGVVAHHMVLAQGYREADQSWTAVPSTVVFARLPEGARPLIEMTADPAPEGPPPRAALGTLDLSGGDVVVPHPTWTEDVGGFRWRVETAEAPRLMREIAQRAAPALAAAPEGTSVELCEGALCVSVRGVVQDGPALERLCHAAAAVADGVRRMTAAHPSLDPAAPLAPPPETDRSRWVDEGVRTVSWPEPPASVPAAVSAYRAAVAGQARRQGRKVRLIAFAAIAVLFGAFGLISLALDAVFFGAAAAIGFAFFGLMIALPGVFRGAAKAGRAVASEHTLLRARPWGIEAFARGYASARTLAQEDVDAFRHGFDSPIPGRPLKVFRGELGDGLTGRLVMWISRPEQPPHYYLMAVVPWPGGGPAPALPGYETYVRGGVLVIAEAVADEDRSAAKLDALAAAARTAAAVSRSAPSRA